MTEGKFKMQVYSGSKPIVTSVNPTPIKVAVIIMNTPCLFIR